MHAPYYIHEIDKFNEVNRTMDSKPTQIRKDELSLEISTPQAPQFGTSRPSNLRFDRLQPSDQEFNRSKIEFGQFVAREVVLDEEYWVGN